jgi:hypothetical protein
VHVAEYLKAYQKYCAAEGRHEQSAVPLSLAQYQGLMSGLEREVNVTMQGLAQGRGDVHSLLLLQRDAAAFALMWQSCRRGADVLSVQWGGLFASETGEALLSIWGRLGVDAHSCSVSEVFVIPRKTKTEQVTRPSTQIVTAEGHKFAAGCAVRLLGELYSSLIVAGRSVTAEMYVFCGMTDRNSGVLSSSALQLRLKRAVQLHVRGSEAELEKGLTLHSFRRGRLQHERYVTGATFDTLQELAGIKDVGVLQRYLDRGRHLR